MMFCCLLGLFDGCFITMLGPIAFDICDHRGAGQAIGKHMTGYAGSRDCVGIEVISNPQRTLVRGSESVFQWDV